MNEAYVYQFGNREMYQIILGVDEQGKPKVVSAVALSGVGNVPQKCIKFEKINSREDLVGPHPCELEKLAQEGINL